MKTLNECLSVNHIIHYKVFSVGKLRFVFQCFLFRDAWPTVCPAKNGKHSPVTLEFNIVSEIYPPYKAVNCNALPICQNSSHLSG